MWLYSCDLRIRRGRRCNGKRGKKEPEKFVFFLHFMELTISAESVCSPLRDGELLTNFMKRIQTIAAYLVVLALAGVSSLKSAEPGRVVGKALVRSISGRANYTDNGTTQPLKVNMELGPGVVITTGPNSYVFLNINGLLSTVRVAANTTIGISEMSRVGSDRDGDTDTMLDLRLGEALGQVKKLTRNSQYQIKTPHGIAGIRGTDWDVPCCIATGWHLPGHFHQRGGPACCVRDDCSGQPAGGQIPQHSRVLVAGLRRCSSDAPRFTHHVSCAASGVSAATATAVAAAAALCSALCSAAWPLFAEQIGLIGRV